MNTRLSRIKSVINALTIVGLCLAALFALAPQRAMAQNNILEYEHEFGKLDGFFHKPHGVAVDQQGHVYVTDFDDDRVQVFDAGGNFLREWGWHGTDPGEFRQPTGIAVDLAQNRVYVAEMGNERIQVFDTNGAFLFHFGASGSAPGQLFDVHDIALGDKGLYVADTWNHRIQIFDKDGNVAHLWGSPGSGVGQFDTPKAIAYHKGTVYVADSGNDRIQVFDHEGAFLWSFGSSGVGNGQFDTPSGIDVDDKGIHVVDSGNHRVQHFDHTGAWRRTVGGVGTTPGLMQMPMGIATAFDGRHFSYYVADSENHRVQRLDASGAVLQILGSAVAPDGHLTDPKGLVYSDKYEAIYVADAGNDRIQVFDVEGHFLRGWNLGAIPQDVAIDPVDHHVWVLTLGGAVQRFAADGTYIASWTMPPGAGIGQIGSPKGIAVDSQQHVYVSNQYSFSSSQSNTDGRITIFDASGTYLNEWGVTGLSQGNPPAPDTFDMPVDIELGGGDRSLYVAVEDQNRIKRVGFRGNLSLDSVVEYYAPSQQPFALAVARDETLFVADTVGRLWYFDKFDDLAHYQDRVTGGGPGEFRKIGDMVYAPESGNHPPLIIITEWENDRIQVFTIDGP